MVSNRKVVEGTTRTVTNKSRVPYSQSQSLRGDTARLTRHALNSPLPSLSPPL